MSPQDPSETTPPTDVPDSADSASLSETGLNSLRAGVGLLEGLVESGRAALGEVERGLSRREDGKGPEPQAVVRSVVQGYSTFFLEMGRTARKLAQQFRSDSGRLSAKPSTTAAADPPVSDAESDDAKASESDARGAGESADRVALENLAKSLEEVTSSMVDVLRGALGPRR